jgi:diguanylate cyclase (GGDEF)-like protein
MTLIKRVRLILLPIVMVIFTLAGYLIYQQSYSNKLNDVTHEWESRLEIFATEYNLEKQAIKSALELLINSPEMISYLSRSNNAFSAYTLEKYVHLKLNSIKTVTPQVLTVQVLNNNKEFVISSDNLDPFEKPTWPKFPKIVLEENQQPIHTLPISQEFVYKSKDAIFELGLIQRFSPEVVYGSDISDQNTQFLAISSGKIFAYSRLNELLDHHFPMGYTLILKPKTNASYIVNQPYTDYDPYNNYTIEISGSDFEIELQFEDKNISQSLKPTLTRITILLFCLAWISYSVILFSIRNQVITPLLSLVQNINNQHQNSDVNLSRIQKRNEVAQLNNAYVDLIERVKYSAEFDSLTGVANRDTFMACLERVIEHRQLTRSQNSIYVLYIDLDNFKKVNDHFGHHIGDKVLISVAEKFTQIAQDSTLITARGKTSASHYLARLAGDEFAIILNNVEQQWQVDVFAAQLNHLFINGYHLQDKIFDIYASIGISVYPDVAKSPEQLMIFGDEAMYHAKSQGQNQFHIFDEITAKNLSQRKLIETELLAAIEQDLFKLVYQPIYCADDLSVAGYEVLLRCPTLAANSIGPDKFIPIAESTGLITAIDLWVIKKAFQQHKIFQEQFDFTGIAAINISAKELTNTRFPSQLQALLNEFDINPETIELEITETSLVDATEMSDTIFSRIKSTGVKLALDDFGTGYTGFNQLSNFPINTLKIDRSFVTNISAGDQASKKTFDVLIQLAKIYELKTVVEGVETESELNYVREFGDYMQGYHLSKPLDFNEFNHLIRQGVVEC